MTRCFKRTHGCSSSLLSAISNSPLRGFNPPQRADCLESGSQGSAETGGYPHRECIEAGDGAGGAATTVIRDKSRQKRGVISAVWVTNCWTSGLNGLWARKTPNKEAWMRGKLGLSRHRSVEIIHLILTYWLKSESNSKGKLLSLEFIKGFVSVLPTLTNWFHMHY